ncbi:structural maintenance of chromosomes protein 4 [Trichomonascus vanleenenianus]|uniref:condensin subunit SMC4 n=1 Tax=Trichomonascus vanleenenianus TaxID=2268995 RepID=UPI003EC9D9DD
MVRVRKSSTPDSEPRAPARRRGKRNSAELSVDRSRATRHRRIVPDDEFDDSTSSSNVTNTSFDSRAEASDQEENSPLRSRGPTPTPKANIEVAHLEPVLKMVPDTEDIENMGSPQRAPAKQPVDTPRTPLQEPRRRDSGMTRVVDSMGQVSLDSTNKPSLIPESPGTMLTPNGRTVLIKSPTKVSRMPSIEQVQPKQRLVIRRLVLNNFKSYAGRQEIGPFHSSFSAVVGPNGSGKSNVIDSLLFVFGFRASKMRQSKISSLIHASSAMPNLTSCSVEVHFQDVRDNADGSSTPVSGTELVVTRKAFKNNSSRYFINEKDSSFTEVTTLLKDRGIDLDHKRFLILQGEVESIAQMKAKAENENDDGLLEYLEDVIGTSVYKKGIEESQLEVETLNEECLEKENRLNIVDKELSGLEDQKEQILGYLETENDIALKKSALYQLLVYTCNSRIELSSNVIAESQQRLQKELETTAVNREEVDRLSAELKEQSRELDALKKKSQEASKKLSKLEIENVQQQEKKKHLENKQKKLEKTIQAAVHARNESQAWIDNYDEESQTLTKQLTELEQSLEKEIATLEQIQDELKDKTQSFTDEIESIQRDLEPWRVKINAKESETAVAQSQVDLLQERAKEAETAVVSAKEKVDRIKLKATEKQEELGNVEESLKHTISQIELGEEEMKQATQGFELMKQKRSAMRQKLASAKEAANSFKSQNKVLKSLTRLSESGRIEGFHGRLGALGVIDQKYDVAISTACPALDNIVVETVETGQQCVEYLRKNNLGRAKFILLDRLPKRNLARIDTPENVPRLFDLITPKHEKFLPAFYSIMSDTLVAKDPDQARRIAYGRRRWRVVTLGGMLIDTAGTMSGGGNSVKSGAMRDKITEEVSEDQVREMEEYLAKYEERVLEATSKYEMMENALKEFREEKPVLELSISKLQMELRALEQDYKEAKAQCRELIQEQQNNGSLRKELDAAEELVAQRRQELEGLKSQTHGMEQQIAGLQEKIMQAGGVRLRMQKSTVDGIREKMSLFNSRLSNGVMERTKMQNEVKKQTRIIDSAEKSIEEGKEAAEELNQSVGEMAKRIAELEESANALSDEIEEKQEALDAKKSDLEERQAQIDSVRSVEIEIRNTIEQHQKSLKDDTRSREKWSAELKELTLHDPAMIRRLRRRKRRQEKLESQDENDDGNEDPTTECELELPAAETPQADDDADMDIDGQPEEEGEGEEVCFFEYSEDELSSMNKDQLARDIAHLEETIQNAKVDMQVLKDYQRRADEYETRRRTMNEAVAARDAVKKRCDDLKQRRLDEFMAGFNAISMKLKEMYQMITMGGNAELELVDSLDPFSEGIIFSVMPPKKSWRNISNLSGGEKTLSSLALVFALHHYKPTPLYVMDEIDAALDFRNVSIVATYIKERTKNGQFIVISLRNNMFELAKQLVGIYKVNNMTRSIALENKPIESFEEKKDNED